MKLLPTHENCSGCGTCRLSCAISNFGKVGPSWARLRIEGRFPSPGNYRIRLCDQCGECAKACPVGAIFEENGIFKIDEDECTSCMICVDACPMCVMMTHPRSEFPNKCILCGECAKTCPRDAISLARPCYSNAEGEEAA